jgi:hypothetical protein
MLDREPGMGEGPDCRVLRRLGFDLEKIFAGPVVSTGHVPERQLKGGCDQIFRGWPSMKTVPPD